MSNITVKLQATEIPVGKIVCIGRNFAAHAKELGNKVPDSPILFMKPASCIVPDGGTVVIPDYANECHHEVELAVLIGKAGAKNAALFAIQILSRKKPELVERLKKYRSEMKEAILSIEL